MSDERRITDPVTGGAKGQKLERFDLIPPVALEEVARVYGFGAEKYSDLNYLKGYRWNLSIGAAERHLNAFKRGEDGDPESGLHHLAHLAWHALTLMTYQMYSRGVDDRIGAWLETGAPTTATFADAIPSSLSASGKTDESGDAGIPSTTPHHNDEQP